MERVKGKKKALEYRAPAYDRNWLVEEAAGGISASTVNDLVGLSSLKKDFFAELLNISGKTLSRYLVQKKKINPSGSELLLKLRYMYQTGIELFADRKAFQAWIELPSAGLNNKTPLELIQTSTGIDLVLEELQRIEFGYPS